MLMSGVEDSFTTLSAGLDRYRGQVEAAGQRLAQDASDAADRARLILIGGCAAALAICVLLTVLAARAIARPVVHAHRDDGGAGGRSCSTARSRQWNAATKSARWRARWTCSGQRAARPPDRRRA